MKKLTRLLCLLLSALLLTGCTVDATDEPAVPGLPPVEADDAAPLGDAGLQHESIAVMYLPSLDGQGLLAYYEPLTLTHAQHPAESILRALLAFEGNSRVRALGDGVTLSLSGANPVEVSGGVCTVNLSASALQLSSADLYTAALAIAATLCELEDIDYVNLLVASTPVAMDVSGLLPLGSLTTQVGQELPVLWEQFSARRVPVGQSPADTPLTSAATLYFPLADHSGVVAETRRLTFPGQSPEQLTSALLEALSAGAQQVSGACDMPDLSAMLLEAPAVSTLTSGGKRVTLHFAQDVRTRITDAGCDPACCFASIVYTITTFVPSVQQVCILMGDGALTSLYGPGLGSMLFPGGLHTRTDYAHALLAQTTVYLPQDGTLERRVLSLPYRSAASVRSLLLQLSPDALPAGLTDADVLGLSIDGDTLRINLSARYAQVIRDSGMDQRLMAYSVVNTLCEALGTRRVRFYFSGETADGLGTDVMWSGDFLYNPGLVGR